MAAVPPPLFISTSLKGLGAAHGSGVDIEGVVTDDGCDVCMCQIISHKSGKTSSVIENVILHGVKAGIEDIYLVINAEEKSESAKRLIRFVEKLKVRKRKLLKEKCSISCIFVPRRHGESSVDGLPHCFESEELRFVADRLGPIMTNGFVWTHALMLPVDDWKPFIQFSRSLFKKDSTALAVLYPELRDEFRDDLCQFLIVNQKTKEILCVKRMDLSKCTQVNIKEDFPLKGHFANPQVDGIEITSEVLSFCAYYATHNLVTYFRDNFDYVSLDRVLLDSLANDTLAMENFYLYSEPLSRNHKKHSQTGQVSEASSSRSTPPIIPSWIRPGVQFRNYGKLARYLKFDALTHTDKMEFNGERSYWKFDEDCNNLYHESVKDLMATTNLDFRNSFICQRVRVLCNTSCQIAFKSCYLCPYLTLQIPNDVLRLDLENVAFTSGKSMTIAESKKGGFIIDGVFVEATCERDLRLLQDDDMEVPSVKNDPAKMNIDDFWDTLYEADDLAGDDLAENSMDSTEFPPEKLENSSGGHLPSMESSETHLIDDSAGDLCFINEAQSMLLTVINTPSNVQNIIMELRTFRLAEFKTDFAVLQAILPICLAHVVVQSNRASVLSKFTKDSNIEILVQSFCGDPPNIKHHFLFYDSVLKLTQDAQIRNTRNQGAIELQSNPALSQPSAFPRLCAAFDECFTEHAKYLPKWHEENSSMPRRNKEILNSKILKDYLEFLKESDEEDDDSEESSE